MIDLLDKKMPGEICRDVAQRMVAKRKALGLTQPQLAEKSGVSLGSLKRFERTYQISFSSLVNIAFALQCADDFEALFAHKGYRSIDEVIAESKQGRA